MNNKKANIIAIILASVLVLATIGIILGVVLSDTPDVNPEETDSTHVESTELPSDTDAPEPIVPPEPSTERTDDNTDNESKETGDIHLDVGEPNDKDKSNEPEIDDFVVIPGVKEGEE